MARPTTKTDLTGAATQQFEKLWKLFDSMSEEEQQAALYYGADFNKKEAHWERDKNLRDVFIHLYEWHQLLLNWVESNQKGESKPFLPEPYNWKSYGKMNVEFWEKHQNTSLSDSVNMLKESHEKVLKLIEEFTNEELFSKGVLSWTGTSPLGSYCASATSSHYEWALKKMRLYHKNFTPSAR